jgi:hypothetical protein
VLHVDKERALSWSMEEVVEHWMQDAVGDNRAPSAPGQAGDKSSGESPLFGKG